MKPYFLTIMLSCLYSFLSAQVRLPNLVRDSMVLQRDARINIWGWASPGEKLTIRFNNRTYRATTGPDGKWAAQMNPTKAGGPYSMQITGSNTITLNEILVGDVWFCSGQSNMVHQLSLHSERYAEDIRQANYPQIRHFWIPTTPELQGPKDDLPAGNWKWANPQDVLQFSVVAYFFARNIYEKYGVPIGLINASVGGTPIEAWTSEEGLKDFSEVLSTIQRNKDTAYVNNTIRRAQASNAVRPPSRDKGITGAIKWFDPAYVPSGWHTINIPGYWEDQGIRDLNGVVWYRREIDIPASMINVPAKISMGRIVDADVLYVNGKQVGTTTYQYPQRRYQVPPGTLTAGRNIITIRVTNHAGKGGFVPDKPYYLAAGNDTIDLKGYWQYKVGEVFPPTNVAASGINLQNQPAALYNAMVAPVTNFAIKGVLWYQGESNISNAHQYEKLLPALIYDWRARWGRDDLPFLYVQLPNFQDVAYLPSESNLAVLREAQRKTLSIPHTGMAVAIDLGEWNDIHPGNKKDVGIRLALAARRIAYNEKDLVYSGPLLQTARTEGNRVILFFNNTGSGLTTNNGEDPNWFAIAGADKAFVWANTRLESNKVIVWHDAISDPRYVRYAWADNPLDCNLYNREGLPASPFEKELTNPVPDQQTANSPWNNKRAAVVLTYDDALNVHLSNAIPVLDSFGLKGTFYLSDYFGGLQAQIPRWKTAANNGHELANHTIHHPCEGGRPGREFVKPETDLRHYSVKRITNEMKTMNTLLTAIDGKTERTFAFPCNDTKIGDTAYINYAKGDFVAARAVRSELPSLDKIDLYNLPAYMVNGETGEQLIAQVKKAVAENRLLVFLFHGVGGEHGLDVSLPAHRQLLQYLKQNENDIWVAPMLDIANFIKNNQGK
ncbi:MAG TPA: sialate O-acetylesterase [Flavisolibacter sp.]|nr:sialate O-acetylesterase [Flavisolibacter sp.]